MQILPSQKDAIYSQLSFRYPSLPVDDTIWNLVYKKHYIPIDSLAIREEGVNHWENTATFLLLVLCAEGVDIMKEIDHTSIQN